MSEATAALQRSEAAAKKQLKLTNKKGQDSTRFPPGTLWELIHADGVILGTSRHPPCISLLKFRSRTDPRSKVHSHFSVSLRNRANNDDSESYMGYLQCL
jgi:hypothetical protein